MLVDVFRCVRFYMKKTKLEFENLFPFKCKSLVAISYERFMSVAFPMRFKMDYRIAYCVCASIWVIAGGIAAPLLTSRIYKVNLLFLFFSSFLLLLSFSQNDNEFRRVIVTFISC